MKYDTKEDGPWDDRSFMEPEYIPREYRGLMDRLYPWQQKVLDSRHVFDTRHVNFVYDGEGNSGKSTLAQLAELYCGAYDLPPVCDHKELMQHTCDILMAKRDRTPGLIFVDLPRGLTVDPRRFGPFMIAVEKIKAGVVQDMRNHFTKWWFDSPQVWVFANHLPNLEYLSEDRYKFFIIRDKDLVQVSKDDLQPPLPQEIQEEHPG